MRISLDLLSRQSQRSRLVTLPLLGSNNSRPESFQLEIQRSHQIVFLFAAPALNPFSRAMACRASLNRSSKPGDQPCETLDRVVAVEADSAFQTVCDASGQHDATAIGHHINEERLHSDCEVPRRPRGSG